jgi:hypothetical protein
VLVASGIITPEQGVRFIEVAERREQDRIDECYARAVRFHESIEQRRAEAPWWRRKFIR